MSGGSREPEVLSIRLLVFECYMYIYIYINFFIYLMMAFFILHSCIIDDMVLRLYTVVSCDRSMC